MKLEIECYKCGVRQRMSKAGRIPKGWAMRPLNLMGDSSTCLITLCERHRKSFDQIRDRIRNMPTPKGTSAR